ncbi:hypothetical protein ACSV9I_01085 [Rhizobium sp. G187]|uniref:hypothetical protein n=1 Tax=Rhizobium sp. G187 TaxID=3451352 RepID=UPI003EE57069
MPAWPAYGLAGVLSILGIGVTALSPYFSPPVTERPIGLVFGPWSTEEVNLRQTLSLAADVRLIDSQYGGRVIFVQLDSTSADAVFAIPGLLHAFDAVAAGCHGLQEAK